MLEIVRTVGKDSADHPFSTRASYTALAVMFVYSKVVRRLDSLSLCGSIMARISDSNLGFFSSVLGLSRADMSFTHAMRSEERSVGKGGRFRCDWSSDVCSSDLHCAAP